MKYTPEDIEKLNQQWDKVELKAYKADAQTCTGLLFKPGDKQLQVVTQ